MVLGDAIATVLGDERPKPGEAEHLAFWVVSLYEPVAVECLVKARVPFFGSG
jgi:hypothetical protein